MKYSEMIEQINKVNDIQGVSISALPHCSNLLFQIQKQPKNKEEFFTEVVQTYLKIRNIKSSNNIDEYINSVVDATNTYKDLFWPPNNNPFSHQQDFGSSIIPEMLCLIFDKIIKDKKANLEVSAQKDLTIECIFDFTDGGKMRFKNKKVDVAVVKNCALKLDDQEEEFPIPLLAIECKTNIDKNMLSGIEFSVGELKKTFPECSYLVVTEVSDFDVKNVNYASSGINEMYVLRCQKRAQIRQNPESRKKISIELVQEIATELMDGIDAINCNEVSLDERMKNGKLIGRSL